MKKILITGENSYVGNAFEKWSMNYPGKYSIDKISMRDGSWKERDFSSYDVLLHVAGIAHQKETKENANLYYEVNRDLTFEVAQKAKDDGVKQFIFLSSMSVYGIERGVIYKSSIPNPKSNYGKSKLQAEELIKTLEGEGFKITILRPPMIYGRGCKGNYPRLVNLAVKIPIFPEVDNKRSMIYIENLTEFIKLVIDNESSGLFFPQNREFVNTTKMVKLIAEVHGKKIWVTKLFNPLLSLMKTGTINKVLGDLVYEKGMSKCQKFNPISLEESIKYTET